MKNIDSHWMLITGFYLVYELCRKVQENSWMKHKLRSKKKKGKHFKMQIFFLVCSLLKIGISLFPLSIWLRELLWNYIIVDPKINFSVTHFLQCFLRAKFSFQFCHKNYTHKMKIYRQNVNPRTVNLKAHSIRHKKKCFIFTIITSQYNYDLLTFNVFK